ncbi:MAG: STAS domain-containing protein [Spirochaetes bacterium]|nr:STAS domain-containing protein [Spirochaetota bacterium]
MPPVALKKNTCIIVGLKGDIDIQNKLNIMNLKRILSKALRKKTKQLIINMEQVTYIDSSGIGTLIMAVKKIYQQGGEFYLYKVPDYVMQIFVLTKIYGIFNYCNKLTGFY